jgi:hypothetical protein
MSYAQPTAKHTARQNPSNLLRRAIAASALGNATEWFDYGIYAYGLTYISAALFPGSTAEATLFALATFAISFLVRPLGGLFWGPLGDRLGRVDLHPWRHRTHGERMAHLAYRQQPYSGLLHDGFMCDWCARVDLRDRDHRLFAARARYSR